VFTLLHRRERNNYYNGILLRKRDIKEAITHEPERSWLSAWQVGARICFVIGGALVVAGAVLRLIDFPG